MRELKIRAIYKNRITGELAAIGYNVGMNRPNHPYTWSFIKNVMYIGLKDNKEKEIYEGDILKVYDPYGEVLPNIIVTWDNNGCVYPFEHDFGDYDVTSIGWAMQQGFRFEITGNIHDQEET